MHSFSMIKFQFYCDIPVSDKNSELGSHLCRMISISTEKFCKVEFLQKFQNPAPNSNISQCSVLELYGEWWKEEEERMVPIFGESMGKYESILGKWQNLRFSSHQVLQVQACPVQQSSLKTVPWKKSAHLCLFLQSDLLIPSFKDLLPTSLKHSTAPSISTWSLQE